MATRIAPRIAAYDATLTKASDWLTMCPMMKTPRRIAESRCAERRCTLGYGRFGHGTRASTTAVFVASEAKADVVHRSPMTLHEFQEHVDIGIAYLTGSRPGSITYGMLPDLLLIGRRKIRAVNTAGGGSAGTT